MPGDEERIRKLEAELAEEREINRKLTLAVLKSLDRFDTLESAIADREAVVIVSTRAAPWPSKGERRPEVQ